METEEAGAIMDLGQAKPRASGKHRASIPGRVPIGALARSWRAVWLVLAAGCAGDPVSPATVAIAVAEPPCRVAAPPRPAFPVDALPAGADIWTIGTALWADRQARKAYELQLETAIKGCSERNSQGARP